MTSQYDVKYIADLQSDVKYIADLREETDVRGM